jgi:predicted ATP-dependent endonuclease of OLD family
MRYRKFTIQNYRAIEKTVVEIGSNRLIPLIGINESGKTSELQAILCFHRLQDTFEDGKHLEYENKYSLKKINPPCIISADLLIENNEEINYIANKLKIEHGGEFSKQLIGCFEKGIPIRLSRELNKAEGTLSQRYYVENFPIAIENNDMFAESLFDLVPNIIYFKSFGKEIEYPITIPVSYLEGKDQSKLKEWRDLLEELISKTTSKEYSLKDFVGLTFKGSKQGTVLSQVNHILNKDVIAEWERLRSIGNSISDESLGTLTVKLEYLHNPANQKEQHEFYFNVVDNFGDEAGKMFSINDRSTGLLWFFNFIIKLKYNPDTKNSGALYLLDEPGSNLHSSAQEGLLIKLKEIADKVNPVIYGTHAEDLLNPDIINIACIKIVSKENGTIMVRNFNEDGTKKIEGALTPLYRALHKKSGFNKFQTPNVIITEGIIDYYLFRLISQFTKLIHVENVNIVPGAGAAHLKDLISIAISSTQNYWVLLDSDEIGLAQHNRYTDFFGQKESENFILYEIPEKQSGVILEDFLSKNDQAKLLALTNQNDLKKALIELFFHRIKEVKEKFMIELDDTSVKNLTHFLDKINLRGINRLVDAHTKVKEV